MPDTPLRAVTYARQSLTRGPDEESLSIEVQTRACREHIARQGWELVGTYEDPDQKGWKQHRPAFDAMLQRFRDGGADIAVVFKLSRFARDLMHQETIIGEIADAGGDLASVTEPFISTSPMVRQILGAVNEQYRRDQSDFLRASFAGRARRGHHHGAPPFGYQLEDGVLVPDEPRAAIIRTMFQWALEGHGSPEITYRLNAEGRTGRAGRVWSQTTVLRALRNRTYAGDVVLHGDVVARDAHEPIVEREAWQRVQEILATRRGQRRKQSPSWAEGFLWHDCGTKMYCVSWREAASDVVRWRFRCRATTTSTRHDPNRCMRPNASIFATKAEAIFVRLLLQTVDRIADPADVIATLDASYQHGARDRDRSRRRLDRQIADTTRQRDRLLDMALRGRVTEDLYVERDTVLRDTLARLKAERDTIPAPVDTGAIEARHAELVRIADILPAVAEHAPHKLPPMLHQLGARLIVGPEPQLTFGTTTGAFFGH